MPTVGVKRCSKCGEFKPLKEFYPRYNRGGVRPDCKSCFIRGKNERRKGKPSKLRDRFLGY